jgi:hypothetical protein
MNKEFIPYEQALALKELGFDESCFAKYYQQGGSDGFIQIGENEIEEAESAGDDITFECDAPLYQQAFRFFREKYKMECYIKSLYEQRENKGFYFGIDDYNNRDFYSKAYYSHKEAELECLKKLIEICKKN